MSPSGVKGATRAYSPPRKDIDIQHSGLPSNTEVDVGVIQRRRLRRPMSAQPAMCRVGELSSRSRGPWPASSGLRRTKRPSTAGSGRRSKSSISVQGSNGAVASVIDVADI